MSQRVLDTTASQCLCTAHRIIFTVWVHGFMGPHDPHSESTP